MFPQSLLFFIYFYMTSIMLAVSCSDWFLIWVSLEINMMSFISLIYDRSASSVEASLKYFLIQSLGSGILIMLFYSEFKYFNSVGAMALVYKIGGGPFFIWFPSLCDSMGWGSCFLLMTIQKLLPLMIMSLMISIIIWFMLMVSLLVGALGAINQKSMKRLLAFSSIHHIGWMLASGFISSQMWGYYLAMYTMMISGVIYILWKSMILNITGLKSISFKWSFVLGMLSLGGMPPLLGFFLKWYMFLKLLKVDFTMIIMMIITSIIMFYVYLQVSFSMIMGGFSMSSWTLFSLNEEMNFSIEVIYMWGISVGSVIWLLLM